MNKIKCLAVDDEPLALGLIEGYITKTPFLELTGSCNNGVEALMQIHAQQVSLLFLDIQMPDLNGIELSKTLINGPKVIFTTAFEQYALQGFKVDAIDYLLKPFNYAEFFKAANKAKTWFDMQELSENAEATQLQSDSLFVRSEYKLIKVTLSEILYIEGLKDYVKIYITSQEKPVMSLMSLKTLEERLSSQQFMRIHRSYIVNLEKIDSVERSQVIINKIRITVADQYKERFNQFILSKSMNT